MSKLIVVSDTDNPYENNAIEDALMSLADTYETILFLWINRPSLVLGRNQNPWKEVYVKRAESLGVDIVRRSSGGGTVYHDWGNLNYSFIANKEVYDENKNFKIIQESLENVAINAVVGARKDLLVGDNKVSGTAFYLKKERRIHHGTLLVDVDTSLLWQLLRFDDKGIMSKAIGSKRSDIINLNQLNPSITVERMIEHIKTAFIKYHEGSVVANKSDILDGYSAYINMRTAYFKSWQWNFGETPKFQYKIGNTGYLEVKDGKVVGTNDLHNYRELIGLPFKEYSV